MPATSFAAGNSELNTTLAEGHRLLSQYLAPANLTGQLFVNPVASDASPAGGLIAEADFAANSVPTDDSPLYLQLQIPNSDYPATYAVALVLKDLDGGMSLAGALS